MRLLNVSQNHFVRGGSDSYFFALGELLQANGHEVVPFCAASADDRETPWRRYFPAAADFERPGMSDVARFIYSPAARRQMARLIDEQRPDLAHLHIYYGKLTASILQPLKRAGLPIVQTLHEYKQVCPVYSLISHGRICEACRGSHYWHCLAQRCNRGSLARSALSMVESYVSRTLGALEKVDHFIAVSDFQRQKLVELGIPEQKISTVHNFVDCDRYAVSDKPGEYLLYFGRLERLKGVFTLLEAAADLTVPLLIVGSGEAEAELAGQIRERGLDHVRLMGFRSGDELQEMIRGSLCTILPSEWYEPFGLTVIESFAAGRPVVGARIGGIAELINDGVDGLTFASGDAEELKTKLEWFGNHPDDAVTMGLAGRKKVERLFSKASHYEQLMRIYRHLMS